MRRDVQSPANSHEDQQPVFPTDNGSLSLAIAAGLLKETDMIDFVEYVVSELKSKKLSKSDALSLIKQFSVRTASAPVLHPLLHSNTSDLGRQSYDSIFTGEEFFLSDHRVNGQRLLPGVAYLEMARAAVVQASPLQADATTSMELRNVVWMQPVVVTGNKKVTITVFATGQEGQGGERLDYEICSEDEEQEIVHCQGQAAFTHQPAPAPLDIERLKEQMTRGKVEASAAYAAFSKMGIEFGPAFQAIYTIFQGEQQLLACLHLPSAAEIGYANYLLHPSLMDAAQQASIGFAEDLNAPSLQARVPFALESLRIISACTQEMYAWVRYSPANQPADKIFKLDIDLCDQQGNIRVQMRGFSSRVMTEGISSARTPEQMTSPVELPAECEEQATHLEPSAARHGGSLQDKTQEFLRKQCSGLLKLPARKIDPEAALETYGIDSILAMKLTRRLEETFGPLPKTLFFECQTIADLARYFVQSHQARLAALFAEPRKDKPTAEPTIVPPEKQAHARPEKPSRKRFARQFHEVVPTGTNSIDTDRVAIIGLSGRYPEAINVEAYWNNLRQGKDCIMEVPKERWDWREYFSDDRSKQGRHFSKWGGFIAGVDEFDPLFFNISPLEAEFIDPQERLFLQHAWMAIEDAGYTRASLQTPCEKDQSGQVGVYAGLMYSEYQLFGAEASAYGKRVGIFGSAASIANRVSYALNLHGPSMTLDTMCSSSLTAIHIACQDLKQGRTSLAIAGGVNVTIHPNKYLVLSGGQAISSDGHCQSFGEGGDGYIPGEGVGVVILKRLSEAERDGDHIYGIIRGSALNHGGKTNGYTVPNPQAQASAISRALAEAKVDARQISYIEAHGTGTKLGDPIEIAALSKAFQQHTEEMGFCRIGSAKSNIGHCESAAGVAGLTKVLLQMQHGQIVPSLHSAQLNPHIDFDKSPFVVNQELRPWEKPVIDGKKMPRVAGISSFGAGGSNAHLIVEEYQLAMQEPVSCSNVVVLLSARTAEQLKQKARELLEFVRVRMSAIDLAAMGYTLQLGREAMDERLGLVVSSVENLAEKLEAYVAGEQDIEDAYQGQVKRNQEELSLFSTDADLQQTIGKWIENRKLSKLLELWCKGVEVDWSKLYGEIRPQRVSLPTYPFARERYWIDITGGTKIGANGAATAVLHPLLHSNTSDLNEQSYSSTFTGHEFFLLDHQVATNDQGMQKILPGVAYLEMARAAIEAACSAKPESAVLELHATAWSQPIVVTDKKQVSIALSVGNSDQIDYEMFSHGIDQDIVHCQGRAIWSSKPELASLDLEQLKGQMDKGRLDSGSVYAACARMGMVYGPSFQGIAALHRGTDQVLAQLRLPANVAEKSADYVLHPSLMDSALQATVGLIDGDPESSKPRLPFALETLRIVSPCTPQMFAWVRYAQSSQAGDNVLKLDIDLCDESGKVCVQMHGLSLRAMSKEISKASVQSQTIGSLLAVPVWKPEAISSASKCECVEHHVVLCEMTQISAGKLQSLLPQCQCLSLKAEEERNIAQRYCDYAVACFELIQKIVRSKPQGKALVQIVVANQQEQILFAGLGGLLRTAALENPKLICQLVLTSQQTTAEELAAQLQAEPAAGLDSLLKGAAIRYGHGVRRVLGWEEVTAEVAKPALVWQEQGAYLITGGLGGLGLVFAKEILEQTREAKVVLTGRSALDREKQARINGLCAQSGRVSYQQVDLCHLEQVKQLISGIQAEKGKLNGILHSAGMIADNFILKKSSAEFNKVMAPKVTGTYHLDQASQGVELDFFVMFSSIAGAMGNVGQADYATANGFMDQFAAYRNALVAAEKRYGRTRSINWPLWQAGGMGVDATNQEFLRQATGMHPMQTATGLEAFHRNLALSCDQMLVVEGDVAKLRGALLGVHSTVSEPQAKQVLKAAKINPEGLQEKMQEYLRKQFSGLLKLPSHKIDPQAALETYGIDSILAMRLTSLLEQTFGSLSKTLFFEYQTIAALAGYFVKSHPAIVREAVGVSKDALPAKEADHTAIERKHQAPAKRSKNRFAAVKTNHTRDIAIVGVAGRYPQAENLEEFWTNLKAGRDCISEIPADRWNSNLYFEPEYKVGKSYTKWGGFVADVDKFDPLFFNISPREAELIDPQERLFLETAWQTIEDAGYSKENISGKRVGVYVGVMWGQYELFGAESISGGDTAVPSSSYASIANRVSYFFDFHGPSIALDTMCSSSLTAIHLACEELRKGEIDAALAGGVNLTLHPNKYLSLSQGKFAASDGKCRSFGKGGDGYVPGEGVGAVLLKSLENAVRDGDRIYAVIKSSAVNHGGKTNGYTVPNPNAQAELILDAFKKANIDPGTLSYVETHGTGTSLGDPIEITGLSKAFEGYTQEKQFCPIGSVKSNIGHLESAAGIAAITKALLQIKHKQLVPSLHAQPRNPNIDFEQSPFYVQTELTEWKLPVGNPRRVGVSSFGAGGSNAHLILEEFADAGKEENISQVTAPEAFVLSARDRAALCRYAVRVVNFLEKATDILLPNIAFTSQVARTPMDARLIVLASSVEDLKSKLNQWIALQKNKDIYASAGAPEFEGVYCGNVKEVQYSAGNLIEGRAGKAFLEDLIEHRDLEKIARLWILGIQIDWSLMYRGATPRKVSFPTYPFAKERYWLSQGAVSVPTAQKHPVNSRKEYAHEPVERKERTYYRAEWSQKTLSVSNAKLIASDSILILDTSDDLFLSVTEQVKRAPQAGSVALVKPGKSFQKIKPNIYLINPTKEDQFHELIEDLRDKGQVPSVVIHHCLQVCNLEAQDQVAQQLDNGVHFLFHLCKAWMKEKHQPARKIISVFSSPSGTAASLASAMGGFFRTLTLENPKYIGKVVDIQESEKHDELSRSDKASLIWNEVCDQDWTATTEVRYCLAGDDKRHVRHINELAQYTPVARNLSTLPLRQNGVYLITGGFGGLGFIFAEYLAKNFQAKLVLIGRSSPTVAQEEKLSNLRTLGAEVLSLRADVSKLEDLKMVVGETKLRFSEINGVIHSAGVNRDAFILKKTKQEMDTVFASKVYGTINLDLATSAENLDLFVMFSSVAGVLGNVGQSDYAYGNHFLNSFAERREQLRSAHKRSGQTLSISWPLWEAGGMSISSDGMAVLEKRTGICPLPTEDGIQYWEDFLGSGESHGVALYGIPVKINAYIDQKQMKASGAVSKADEVDPATLFAKTEAYLKSLIGEAIKLSPDRIGSLDSLESFGIDSVMINRINTSLENDLGALPKTLLYEHETVREIAQFLRQEALESLVALLGFTGEEEEPVIPPSPVAPIQKVTVQSDASTEDRRKEDRTQEPIAIIGIHARFPHSANMGEYWENLKQGKDLIDPIPPSRWDYEELYDPDPSAASDGKVYCKWGGFLDEHDKFDPQFFKISPEEARVIDPQERLVLESVWAAIEDAGYTRENLKKRFPKAKSADVGVFVGVTTNSYHLWTSEERNRGNFIYPSALPWSIANRVSYFFDFNGPSLPIDTACSSSLVAVHLACESLNNSACQVAIAGGVNLYLHPSKYQSLCQRRMLSLGGKCRSYGAGDDGFVPGEGVGTLVLKRLSHAVKDQDNIYALIPASAYDHSGRSNGYSAPNPNSQAHLISNTLKKAGIHPESISYVEGHGTGTQLGDSIEVAALTQAFNKQTAKKQFCPIGSVKANIGHAESAAGIAGIAKVVLQMKHRQLAPSLHSGEVNPDIEFSDSPFYLQHGLSEWKSAPNYPRRALVNSFGAGGVNACVVLEEHKQPCSVNESQEAGPCLFVLSAKDDARLQEYANRLLMHLSSGQGINLVDLCYTLQVGREAMAERLAIVASNVPELVSRLDGWSKQGTLSNIYRGSAGSKHGL
jgi:polyketide synthase PksL